MTNEEKLDFINNKIDNLNIHIGVLEADIYSNPDLDVPGKPLRSEILSNLYIKKQALEDEKETLTNQE